MSLNLLPSKLRPSNLCQAEIVVKENQMRILFFAQLKDAAGCESAEMKPTSPLNTEQLWAELLKQFPKLAAHRASARLACNQEYATPDAKFSNNDEVALIPPVSGG
jgi:molybdopterin converting factor subunit 1